MDRGAWWAPAHGATKTSRTVSSWDNIRSIKWTITPGLQVAIAKGTGVEGVDGTSKDLGFIFLIVLCPGCSGQKNKSRGKQNIAKLLNRKQFGR